MQKIEIHLPDNVIEEIMNTANFLRIPAEELCSRILCSYTQIVTQSPTYNAKLVVKNSIFDELKIMMDKYNISQNDLANYLKVSQAAISYSFAGKNNSKLKQTIDKLGIVRFILAILQHKFFLTGDTELYKNSGLYNSLATAHWPNWKKILFGYYLNNTTHELPKEYIANQINILPNDNSAIFDDMSIDVDTFIFNLFNLIKPILMEKILSK